LGKKVNQNQMTMKNKKADERLLSIYLFIIYTIVSIGVVSGVVLFHGSALDVREVEAGILNDKIIDCLVEEGELINEVLDSEFDVSEFCKIKPADNSVAYSGEEQIGVRIRLFDFESCVKLEDEVKTSCTNDLMEDIEIGRTDFFGFCDLEGDKIPKCSEKNVYVLNDGERIVLNVLSAVRKVEKNV
jgi:hypothetical protein